MRSVSAALALALIVAVSPLASHPADAIILDTDTIKIDGVEVNFGGAMDTNFNPVIGGTLAWDFDDFDNNGTGEWAPILSGYLSVIGMSPASCARLQVKYYSGLKPLPSYYSNELCPTSYAGVQAWVFMDTYNHPLVDKVIVTTQVGGNGAPWVDLKSVTRRLD